MSIGKLFDALENCVPGNHFYPLNVIDVRTKPKAIYTLPKMVIQNSINHLTDNIIHQSKSEPYSRSTSYYTLVTQDSAHTTWHQDYSATSVFYTVLTGEKIFFLVKPTRKNLQIFQKWSDAENDTT